MTNTETTLAAKQPDEATRSAVSFRLAAQADVAPLVTLINVAYEREHWLLPAPRTETATLAQEIADTNTRLIVAEAADALAGCIRVRLAEDGAWFGLLAVAPAMQGRGLASLIIAEAEATAAREGAREMRLECAEELGMPPYYASLGYEFESREPGKRFNGNPVDITRIVMRKSLS